VASRRWSYRDLLAEADLDALSVEETTADFAQGLVELRPGSAVSVAERFGHVVGYVYILQSPDPDVPAGPLSSAASTSRRMLQGRASLEP